MVEWHRGVAWLESGTAHTLAAVLKWMKAIPAFHLGNVCCALKRLMALSRLAVTLLG